MGAVEDYLEALDAQDWDRLAGTIAETDVVRDGPFVDVIEGKGPYVDFLRGIVSTLPDYGLTLHRLWPSEGNRVFAEVSESFVVGDSMTSYPEILVFETNPEGKITYVSVFMKFPGMQPPVEGGSAAG